MHGSFGGSGYSFGCHPFVILNVVVNEMNGQDYQKGLKIKMKGTSVNP